MLQVHALYLDEQLLSMSGCFYVGRIPSNISNVI